MSIRMHVPVVPNAARIRAHRAPTKGEEPGRMKVVLDAADDVEGMPNFARDYVGHTVELQVPDAASAPPSGAAFRATVSFRGDERGGQFVLKGPIENG